MYEYACKESPQVPPEVPVSVDALGEIVKTSPSCWRTFCALVYIRTVRMIRDPYKLYVMIFMPISKSSLCYGNVKNFGCSL